MKFLAHLGIIDEKMLFLAYRPVAPVAEIAKEIQMQYRMQQLSDVDWAILRSYYSAIGDAHLSWAVGAIHTQLISPLHFKVISIF